MCYLRFLSAIFFISVHFFLNAQGLPYLNASAGNANEPVRGLDSSMYMYQNDTLFKINKNLSVVWANQYPVGTFKNLLLSKTGSLFFASNNRIGKINATTGQLIWVKSISSLSVNTGTSTLVNTLSPKQLFLDHNNQLLISGIAQSSVGLPRGAFLKTDTSGNIINAKEIFHYSAPNTFFNIVTDSAGIYSFFTDDMTPAGPSLVLLFYNSITDNIYKLSNIESIHPTPPMLYSAGLGYFKKSLKNNLFYFNYWNNYMVNSVYNSYTGIYSSYKKLGYFNTGQSGPPNVTNSIGAITDGQDLSLTVSYVKTGTVNTMSYLQLDSNYNVTGGATFPAGIPGILPFYSGKTMFSFNLNPPQTNTLTLAGTSTLTPCTQTFSNIFYPSPTAYYTLTVNNIPVYTASLTLATVSASITPVTIFLQQNYCGIIAGISDNSNADGLSFEMFPNPATETLTLKGMSYNASPLRIYNSIGETVRIIDIPQQSEEVHIDLSTLKSGVYYLSTTPYGKGPMKKLLKL